MFAIITVNVLISIMMYSKEGEGVKSWLKYWYYMFAMQIKDNAS